MVGSAGYLAVALVAQVAASTEPTPKTSIWTDAAGDPLPFTTEAEIVDYLETARVVDATPIGVGINGSRKLLLERDGVRIHAIFRDVESERRNVKIGERVHPIFRDSCRYESAAYALGRLLGLDAIPPAVRRTLRGRRGSLQIWLAPTLDETDGGFRPPSASAWVEQLWSMHVFDNLIFNVDRNSGNVLVDTRYKIWMIDHTRAFQIDDGLLDESITRVERHLWQRLVSLTDDEIRTTLSPHLDNREIHSLLARRAKLVEHVRKLIDERGENIILY